MRDLIFSVKEGFRDVTPEDNVPPGEFVGRWADWLLSEKFRIMDHLSTHVDVSDDPAYELYEREEGPWRFLVMMNDPSASQAVYLKDFASVIELRLRLAAQACAERTAYYLGDLHQMAAAMFRVTHRHAFESVCQECNPDAHDRIVEARRRREEAKRAPKTTA